MREIKFRGKRPGTPAWAFGDLAHDKKVCADGSLADRAKVGGYEVDPATIGQFTGLRDAGGREIYEGDIMFIGTDGFDGTPLYCEVGCRDGCFGVIGEVTGELAPFCYQPPAGAVAGNVHDDPGLMGGGGKEQH